MTRKLLVAVVLLVGLLCLQCSKSTEPPKPSPNPPADPAVVQKQLVASSNRFGLNLFAALTAQEDPNKNVFISPLSVSYALAMTYNGAAGLTAEQMASVLGFEGLSLADMNKNFHDLTDYLTTLDQFTTFEIANSIWCGQNIPVREAFIDLNRIWFDAEVNTIDFSALYAADTINHWVAAATHDKITTIVNPPLDPATVMILVNAIYFKGDWTHPFDTARTFNGRFTCGDGSTITTPMMDKDTMFSCFTNDLFDAIDLPYGKHGYSMTILLPQQNVTVDQVIAQMTPENWAAWIAGFTEFKFDFAMPKLKVEYDASLKKVLIALGMPNPFSDEADFSNMIEGGGVLIDDVLHKTFLKVDEKGTEAAGATAVIIMPTGMMGMRVNRPYVMVIREKESRTIVFIGRIAAPEWGGVKPSSISFSLFLVPNCSIAFERQAPPAREGHSRFVSHA